MIEIKDISGNTILSVPVTQECERIEELMKSDHAVLSWNSEKDDILPLGAYIEYKGERLSLLEPYSPEQKDELEYLYKPLFQSKIMAWRKIPFFMYTRVDGMVTSREADWTLTDNPANFISTVCDAIKNETGEIWTYAVDASLPVSKSLSFQSVDIFSALNQIANAFETEWWVDKFNKVIHLSKASHGIAVTLEVGANIKTPSVTSGKGDYFTRFYAFGSTRNIVQDYKGANVNNLVNKRLTLDPAKFPNGYKDIRPGLKQGEIFSKVLVFDDIYPSSKMVITDVRSRLMWVIGENGEKIQVGTDSEGNPIFDQCSIWYFRIPGFVFNNTNFDKDKNPDGMRIEGKEPSVHFESGPLSGREFELNYYDTAREISTSDGITFQVNKGDFELKYIKEGNYIIPDMTAIIPVDGDNIVLFNVKMPSEYIASAYTDLENALDKEMEHLVSDLNNYQFDSNPVSFQNNNPDLSIGRAVAYKNGNYSYFTRVIKLTTKMDYDCQQNITIGNEQTKGTVQELKEEVVSANKDLSLLQAFNDMTSSLQQSYTRTQQMMLDGFASIKNIWQLKEDENGNKYAQSDYHLITKQGISFYAAASPIVPSVFAAIPLDGNTLQWVDGKLSVVGGGGGLDKTKLWEELASSTNEQISITHLTNALTGYATESWVNDKGYITGIPDNYVTTNTLQEINAVKSYNAKQSFNKKSSAINPTEQPIFINGINEFGNGNLPAIGFHIPGLTYANFALNRDGRFALMNHNMDGYIDLITKILYSDSFVKNGGTGNQFLMANGGIKDLSGTWAINVNGFSDSVNAISSDYNIKQYAKLAVWYDWNNTGTFGTHFHGISMGAPDDNIACNIAYSYTNNRLGWNPYTSGWGGWRTILDDWNYNDYVPTLTGGGASGLWYINAAGYSTYFPTRYKGGVQANPQEYFGYNIGLAAAMTGAAGVWYDTLWINGYGASDVPNMCALHFSRQGEPRFKISTQDCKSSTYGAFYDVLTQYNLAEYALPIIGGYLHGGLTIRDVVSGEKNAQIGGTLLVNYLGLGNGGYNEGIRVCNGNNGWSNIHIGAANAWTGAQDGQWLIGKSNSKYLQLVKAGTESGSGKGSHGININYDTATVYTSHKLFVGSVYYDNNADTGITLAIGDSDTGLHWISDGRIALYANSVQIGEYNSSGLSMSKDLSAVGIAGNEIYNHGWFRSYNSGTGWYHQQHGGGIYMEDDTWVKVYNNKRFWVNNVIRTVGSTPTGVNGFGVSCQFLDGIEVYTSDNTFGIGVHANDNIYFWRTISGSIDSANAKSYLCNIEIGSGLFNWYGGILIQGNLEVMGGTAFRNSDMTEKDPIESMPLLSLNDIAKTPFFKFTWKDSRNTDIHVGTSAQYIREIAKDLTGVRANGKLNVDYELTSMYFAISTAWHLNEFINRYNLTEDKRDREIRELKDELQIANRRIEILERRVA